MEHILSVIFIREVNVIEKEREVLEESLGKVKVDGGALQETDVEHCLTHTPSVLNLKVKFKTILTKSRE